MTGSVWCSSLCSYTERIPVHEGNMYLLGHTHTQYIYIYNITLQSISMRLISRNFNLWCADVHSEQLFCVVTILFESRVGTITPSFVVSFQKNRRLHSECTMYSCIHFQKLVWQVVDSYHFAPVYSPVIYSPFPAVGLGPRLDRVGADSMCFYLELHRLIESCTTLLVHYLCNSTILNQWKRELWDRWTSRL